MEWKKTLYICLSNVDYFGTHAVKKKSNKTIKGTAVLANHFSEGIFNFLKAGSEKNKSYVNQVPCFLPSCSSLCVYRLAQLFIFPLTPFKITPT